MRPLSRVAFAWLTAASVLSTGIACLLAASAAELLYFDDQQAYLTMTPDERESLGSRRRSDIIKTAVPLVATNALWVAFAGWATFVPAPKSEP